MAAPSLLALLDDITTILDDVAILTKVAAKKGAAVADDVAVLTKVATQKTAGVLGDDLALNAEQVTGVRAERELPVVWAVFKGSLVNKAILVPAALARERRRPVGGDAPPDAGRRLPVLRGVREGRAQAPAPRRRSTTRTARS